MNSKFTKKIIIGMLLTAFSFTNTAVLAADYRPTLRTTDTDTIKLRADVSITDVDEPITLSLRDSDVKQVLRMFADKAGMNIIFDEGVQGNVTLDLVNTPLNAAFEMILNISKLNYLIENNTLIISGSEAEISMAKQEINTIPVKYIDAAAMADFLNNNIFSMKKPGLSTSNVVTVNPMTNELLIMGNSNDAEIARKMVDKFDKKPISASIKVSHTTPEQMAKLICSLLIPATTGSSGGGGKSTGGAASIKGVMTGGASGSGSGSGVELGGGEVACSVGGNGAMPFQSLIISYFTQQGTIGILGGSEYQLNMIQDFVKENDKKQPQAYLELSIIELNEQGSKTLENTWQYMSKNFSFNAQDGQIGTHRLFPIFLKGDSYPHYGDNPEGQEDYDYSISKYTAGKTSLTYTINYLVENKKGRVVANPRILITNGQESTIDLTSDYIKTVTSQVVSESLTGAVQRTYSIGNDNGIKITVTPFISPDGYVTLNISPEYATVAGQVTTPSETGEGSDIQATLLQRRNLDLKNVRIKDGDTLIIGGLISENDTKTVKKIPVLGDLPLIGALFRSTTTSKGKQEMIIMITPRILDDDDEIANTL